MRAGLALLATMALIHGEAALAQAETPRAAPASVAAPGSVEIAIRRLSDGLAAGFARLPGNTRYRRLAVLVFSEVGEQTQKRKLGTIVAAEVATVLRRDHGLLLVEREKLGQVLGELKLQEMLSVDASQASRIGQMADAQALVVGSVAETGDRYLVTARIVSTQTGESLAAESASIPEAALVAVASDAVVLRSRGDAALRSLLVPGMGQFYNRQPTKGWIFAGLALGLAGGAVGCQLAGSSAQSSYGTATNPTDAEKYYGQAADLYRARDWLLVGLAVTWAVNVVDAYLSGVDGKAMLGGGVALTPAPLQGGGGLVLAARF
jgi:TolB-like protein